MPHANIHLACKLDGSPLSKEDIHEGLVVKFPSRRGEYMLCICSELSEDSWALFKSVDASVSMGYEIEFNVPDFYYADMLELETALRVAQNNAKAISLRQSNLIHHANLIGYAKDIAFTVAGLTYYHALIRYQHESVAGLYRCLAALQDRYDAVEAKYAGCHILDKYKGYEAEQTEINTHIKVANDRLSELLNDLLDIKDAAVVVS